MLRLPGRGRRNLLLIVLPETKTNHRLIRIATSDAVAERGQSLCELAGLTSDAAPAIRQIPMKAQKSLERARFL